MSFGLGIGMPSLFPACFVGEIQVLEPESVLPHSLVLILRNEPLLLH